MSQVVQLLNLALCNFVTQPLHSTTSLNNFTQPLHSTFTPLVLTTTTSPLYFQSPSERLRAFRTQCIRLRVCALPERLRVLRVSRSFSSTVEVDTPPSSLATPNPPHLLKGYEPSPPIVQDFESVHFLKDSVSEGFQFAHLRHHRHRSLRPLNLRLQISNGCHCRFLCFCSKVLGGCT